MCEKEASEKNSTDCHSGRHCFVYLWGTGTSSVFFVLLGKRQPRCWNGEKTGNNVGGGIPHNVQRAIGILIWRIAAKIEESKGRADDGWEV